MHFYTICFTKVQILHLYLWNNESFSSNKILNEMFGEGEKEIQRFL